jgi:hypothetical protein
MNPTPDPQPTPGKKATNAEVMKRVEEIFSIRQAGAGLHDIREYAKAQKWGVSDSQLYRYMQKADDLLSDSVAKDRPKLHDLHIARRRLLYARCMESGDWRAALAVIRDEAMLYRLYEPPKVLPEKGTEADTPEAALARLKSAAARAAAHADALLASDSEATLLAAARTLLDACLRYREQGEFGRPRRAARSGPEAAHRRQGAMNTNTLARHYDKLTARERLPLILTAFKRGDVIETGRLIRSAPTRTVTVADYHGLNQGLELMSAVHLTLQLERACYIGVISGRVVAGKVTEEKLLPVRMLAFQFVLDAEAWKLFCAELHIDPEVLVYPLPGLDVLRLIEELARVLAFTTEEAAAYVRSLPDDHEKPRIKTAAEAAQELRNLLAKCE